MTSKPRPTEIEESPLPARARTRHFGAVVVILLALLLARNVAQNPNFQWNVVVKYLTAPVILEGLRVTVALTAAVMVLAIVLGILLAIMRTSSSPVLRYSSVFYIWLFRGVPALVQLLIWFNLASLYPTFSIEIPFGPVLYTVNANDVVTPWTAAVLGLGLCEAAYMAEIVRAGILSIDNGQSDAARALGMHRTLTLRRIILPQALRVIVPPTGNETIGMLKYTSIASVISVNELLSSAEIVYSRTFEVIPLLLSASVWYLICTSALTIVQYFIEEHYGRSVSRKENGLVPAVLTAVMTRLGRKRAGPAPHSFEQPRQEAES
jgi:polar amino acid transport system permease protein